MKKTRHVGSTLPAIRIPGDLGNPSVKIAHDLVRFDLGQVQQLLLKGRDGGAP
jgi:hypothetical protein